MKKIWILLACILCSFSWGNLHADEVTHQLGNSGYLLRWAMMEGAPKKSPDDYQNALYFQKKAKQALRRHNNQQALELSRLSAQASQRALLKCQYTLLTFYEYIKD